MKDLNSFLEKILFLGKNFINFILNGYALSQYSYTKTYEIKKSHLLMDIHYSLIIDNLCISFVKYQNNIHHLNFNFYDNYLIFDKTIKTMEIEIWRESRKQNSPKISLLNSSQENILKSLNIFFKDFELENKLNELVLRSL